MDFVAQPAPADDTWESLSAIWPQNPFFTAPFCASRQAAGFEPWVLGLQQAGKWQSGCLGLLKSGLINRELEITSLPTLPDPPSFWQGVRRFCQKQRVTMLLLHSFGSPQTQIPNLGHEIKRRKRWEYTLDLTCPDLLSAFGSNHLRNFKRGRKGDLQIVRHTDVATCQTHAQLVSASLTRRQDRGEKVISQNDWQPFAHLLQHGAGEIYQAAHGTAVLSSILILKSTRGAYYQSAGTLPAGMECGASHFLVAQVALLLQQDSIEQFNLGGIDELGSGLDRFKSGFGAVCQPLEEAEFYLGHRLRRGIGTALQRCAAVWHGRTA